MKGYFNKILVINLTERTFHSEDIPDSVYENFLGGKGLAIYLMLTQQAPKVDALSPENNFIIALGPVNDTGIWGSSRYGVFTKSPLTGFFSHSYSGGRVAEPISRTGYDAIVIHGASEEPVFVAVSDEGVEFLDAKLFWGQDTYTTEDYLLSNTPVKGAGALVIGPAGENCVAFASVVNNHWRCAGRTGVGAVLGSKKVKGILFYGNKKREVHDYHALETFCEEWREKAKVHPSIKFYKNVGTPGLVSLINTVGAFPTRYWHEGTMKGWEKISAEELHTHYTVKPHACHRCFMACGRMTTVREGRHRGLTIEGPEYETIYAFGGLCLIDRLDEIIYLNDICDRLGIDTITAGNLAAFTIEASQMGKIKETIDYGDVDAIASLLDKIARREGIGEILAHGILNAAREWGLEDFAIHVKGLEPAAYDPRFFKGMGLAYATSDRGACHLRSTFFRAEISGMIPPDAIEGKAALFIDYEDRLTLQDSLILCRFYRDLYLWDELVKIVRMTTGMDIDEKGLEAIAGRIQDGTRTFNINEGLTRDHDSLPARFFTEPLKAGETQYTITKKELEQLKDDYYKLRGWSREGIPKKPVMGL